MTGSKVDCSHWASEKKRFKFEQLNVWKEAVAFVKDVYHAIKDFPPCEQYGLCAQLSRVAISISANIAEGSARHHDKEFVRFLRMALGSTFEVVSHLHIAREEGYISMEVFDGLYSKAFKTANMLGALIAKLNKSSSDIRPPTSDIR